MQKLFNLPNITILSLLAIIIGMRMCSAPVEPIKQKPTVKVDVVYQHKDFSVPPYTPPSFHYVRGALIRDTVRIPVDTAEIIKDFISKRPYQDTIRLGDYGYVLVRDTVQYNRIVKRKVDQHLIIPDTIKTIIQPPVQKNQVYGGFLLGAGAQPSFGPTLVLKTKQDHLYQIAAGLSPTGLTYTVGVGFKIRLKK